MLHPTSQATAMAKLVHDLRGVAAQEALRSAGIFPLTSKGIVSSRLRQC